jgi:GNAT superfamily N-acetyltransferase
MRNTIGLEPLSKATFSTYCQLGEQAYRDHYLHLWPKEDPSPYIDNSFTAAILKKEIKDPNTYHFIIRKESEGIGILKLIKGKGVKNIPHKDSMLLEKIYLLHKFTGKGFGKQILEKLETMALSLKIRHLWLATMKKGRALLFYQELGYAIIGEQDLPFENARQDEKEMYLLAKELGPINQ